jgi:Xaa-Pro aminopeptidase
VARTFLIERGYAEYLHALGHQVGRSAHDGGTVLAPRWERYEDAACGIVEPGSVFTLEPHVSTVHHGMVALEEDVLVTPDGCRFLSRPQREPIYVGI